MSPVLSQAFVWLFRAQPRCKFLCDWGQMTYRQLRSPGGDSLASQTLTVPLCEAELGVRLGLYSSVDRW